MHCNQNSFSESTCNQSFCFVYMPRGLWVEKGAYVRAGLLVFEENALFHIAHDMSFEVHFFLELI